MSDTDLELLARYVQHRAEDAFAEIVQRHLGLVYSAALRQVRSPQLAEEVAQSVFTSLARDAGQLRPATILTAWLYQVTHHIAANVVRGEVRRQLREQVATEMNAMNATAADGTHIEPLFDEAMHALDETDRTAVLLRYFENKSLREVGRALGASENAAQKRLTRAVEHLRKFFSKRGIGVGASGLVAFIGSNAVQAAPVGLAFKISTAAALAGTTAFTTATAFNIIAMTTLQKVLIATAAIALCVATALVIQQQTKLRKENERTLSAQSQQVLSAPAIVASENAFPREAWAFKGYATPEFALISLVSAAVSRDLDGFLNSLSPEQQSRVHLRWKRQGLTDETQFRTAISNQFGPIKMIRILSKETLSEYEVILRLRMEGERGGTETVGKKAQRIGNEWKIGATL